jgi:hypothetical protein
VIGDGDGGGGCISEGLSVTRLIPIAMTAAAILSACAHVPAPLPEPVLTAVEVATPIATGCVPANMAEPPVYPDSDAALKAATDAAERYQILYAGRKVRIARLGELEPVVANCPKAHAR